MDHPKPASPLVDDAHHCDHLRHKGMYVMTVVDPDEHKFYDPYDATAYWCTKTMRGLGPDGKPVHREHCQGARDCCEH
jgi:hypothetical protein